MKLIIALSFIFSTPIYGQFSKEKCIYSHEKGIVYSNKLLLIPLNEDAFLMEYYTYGGGVFWGAPARDTLVFQENLLSSNKYRLSIKKNKLILEPQNGKRRRFKYEEKAKCDSIINYTRNWTYREKLKYELNTKLSNDFTAATEGLLISNCHEDFIKLADRVKAKFETPRE